MKQKLAEMKQLLSKKHTIFHIICQISQKQGFFGGGVPSLLLLSKIGGVRP